MEPSSEESFINQRKLEFNWEGCSTSPPSESLVRNAEGLWLVFQESKLPEMPVVKAGADGLIGFSWLSKYPDPHMEISLYESDGEFSCDWFIMKNGRVWEGDAPYPCSQIRELLQQYFEK